MNFNEEYKTYKERFEDFLFSYATLDEYPEPLKASMLYALKGEGKRIRPVVFMAICSALGTLGEAEMLFASAIEILHNYTLVHDDLPCMDDDDYRRGRLTVHKKFGQDVAVLCGDALENLAYETVALALEKAQDKIRAISAFRLFATVSGGNGVIGGQIRDIANASTYTIDDLDYIYDKKTAGLFVAAATCAALLCGKEENLAEKFGKDFGYLFQLTDDMLDDDDCFSIKKVLSAEEINNIFEKKLADTLDSAQKLDNSGFLAALTEYISRRKN